jgi:hypothetical protein
MLSARFDFGKHRGRFVEDVDSSYLRWCLRECECLEPWLRRAIKEELRRRDEEGRAGWTQAPPTGPTAGAVTDLPAVIRTWHRTLCLRWHPDRGGSKEAMQAISDAHDLLRQLTGVA